MFGFSLQKLLVLVAVVAAAWYGFKLLGRLQERRDERGGPRRRAGRRAEREGVEELRQCPVCGDYVAEHGAKACERDDCPYRRS